MRVCRGRGRNGRSPTEGIDTLLSVSALALAKSVEMEEARLRALTHFSVLREERACLCRNGRSPTEGIDTILCNEECLKFSK